MATNFRGYLLKFGNIELPNSYLMMDKCQSIPNQRTEIEAYREDYSQLLHRVTATGVKTKQIFYFRPLTATQLSALKTVMRAALVNELQRKYRITYWNDEDLAYETGDFYIPDITYTRARIDTKKNELYYSEFEMHIIEY